MTTSVALLAALSLPLACGDKDSDDTAHDTQTDGGGADGGTADGGTTGDGGGTSDGGTGDGGTGDGGTGDGGTGDGGTGDGGTASGACLDCHGDEAMLQENVPADTGEAHEEPSGEG